MTLSDVDVKVDWFSFTVPLASGTDDQSPDTLAFMRDTIQNASNWHFSAVFHNGDWELQSAGGFYSVRMVDRFSGMRYAWGKVNNHIYVELPGKCCATLQEQGVLENIMFLHQAKCSRIDIAGDWETELTPRNTIGNSYQEGRRAFSEIRSPEGLTVYVGSRKSDRFMRVYRYSKPHPRSQYLRFEHENKGDVAKTVCANILEKGLQETFGNAQNSYHWDLQQVSELSCVQGKIRSHRNHTESASTLLWLLETVAPSLAHSHDEGIINLDTFIEQHVKTRIRKTLP